MTFVCVHWQAKYSISLLTCIVGLGWQGSGGPTLNNSVIAQITSANYILGRLGLNPRPTNFTTLNDPKPSYLSVLYENNEIPSLSYGYSAGAKYRNNGVLGSLTLGGYDEGIISKNNISFPFYFDQTRDLTVGIQAITYDGTQTTPLLSSGILALIDSTVSQMWLPKDACALFQNSFGLIYDNSTGLYFVNATQHTKLVAQNPNVTFTLGVEKTGGQTTNITFPYAAFDLNITYPTVQNSTYYFPIRQAINDTQYTLGRVFLQEAYLTVDYLQSNFSVSQHTWDADQKSHIVSILPPDSTTTSAPGSSSTATDTPGDRAASGSSGLSTGAIVGIVIGVVALLAIISGLFFYLRSRKRKAAEKEAALATAAATLGDDEENKDDPDTPTPESAALTEMYAPPKIPEELQGNYYDGHEVAAGDVQRAAELHAQTRQVELEGEIIRYEMEAPHGMHEMSNMRAMRDDPRWGETSSPMSSPLSRKSVPTPKTT